MKFRFGLLPRVVLAIGLGVGCGFFLPCLGDAHRPYVQRYFRPVFFRSLSRCSSSGWWRRASPTWDATPGACWPLTAALAYAFTLFSGFGTYLTGQALFPALLEGAAAVLPDAAATALVPYFTVGMPPLFGVMSALVLAFVLGLGMAYTHSVKLKGVMDDFKSIIDRVIAGIIIPLLPFYIFGIFLSMTQSGQVAGVLGVFVKLIVVIFFMTVVLLLAQFFRCRPRSAQKPAADAPYDAYGLCHGARHAIVGRHHPRDAGADPPAGRASRMASFVIPLCATIHLSGSMMKIVACALAVSMLGGLDIPAGTFAGFILLLGVTMIAAPGVPGGAIMAALGLLESMLGFDETLAGLMIATYIAMDSFGTATNVTGDGAVAVIVDAMTADRKNEKPNKVLPRAAKAAFFHIKYPEISINAYPCRIKTANFDG